MPRLLQVALIACCVLAGGGASPALAAPGDLTQKPGSAGCISDDGTGGACIDGTAFNTPRALTVSPEGVSVYVASINSGALNVLDRASDGGLTQKPGTPGCISNNGTGGACVKGVGLSGVRGVVVSPDGTSVYGAAYVTDAIAILDRAANGVLTQKPGTAGCISNNGTGGACVDGTALNGAAAVAISPDGTSVYIASQDNDAVVTFDRANDGTLMQKAGAAGCIVLVAEGSCATGSGLDEPRGIAVSPDGKNVYVASGVSDTLTVFDRAADGGLTQKAGAAGCLDDDGDAPCADVTGLDGAFGVTVSPDGANVYAASQFSDAVTIFDRATDGVPDPEAPNRRLRLGHRQRGRVRRRPGPRRRAQRRHQPGRQERVRRVRRRRCHHRVRSRAPTAASRSMPRPRAVSRTTGTGGTCADGSGLDGAFSVTSAPTARACTASRSSATPSRCSIASRSRRLRLRPHPRRPRPRRHRHPPGHRHRHPAGRPRRPSRHRRRARRCRSRSPAARCPAGRSSAPRATTRSSRACSRPTSSSASPATTFCAAVTVATASTAATATTTSLAAAAPTGCSAATAPTGSTARTARDNLDGADAREGHGGDRLDGGPGRDQLRDRRGSATLLGGSRRRPHRRARRLGARPPRPRRDRVRQRQRHGARRHRRPGRERLRARHPPRQAARSLDAHDL